MSDIDNRFVVTSDVDTYYVDKDTGFPLAAGEITFYSDVNRTVKKRVYQLTGSPGSYTYSPLPNPCILSSVGTFQDAIGNNIVPYYFPYEGTPADNNNQVELYYITVYSAGGIEQLTRQAWPNVGGESSGENNNNIINYIPNGQFLLHNDIVSNDQPPSQTFGTIVAQPIAQGGWLFLRSVGGTSTFNNSFSEIIGEIPGINDFPRYAYNFQCTSFNASDSVRDLAISWPDVNKFSAGDPAGTSPFTFMIEAESNDTNTYIFDVRLIRYYGTGGSPSLISDTSIGSFTVTPSESYFQLTIDGIAGNVGIIGTNNDDRIFITIRGPSSTWNIQTTGWVFAPGKVNLTAFPTMTNATMVSDSLMGWVTLPNPNGANLYLPPVLTLQGMTWDDGGIGQIVALDSSVGFTGSIHNTTNLLIADGNAYLTEGYSALGIPYKRLQQYYWNSDLLIPRHGTGISFVSCYFSADGSLRFSTNQSGSQAASADGTSPTGFTIGTIFNGNTGCGMVANMAANGNTLILQSQGIGNGAYDNESTTGLFTPQPTLSDWADAATSGFNATVIYPNITYTYPVGDIGHKIPGNTNFLYTIQMLSLPSAGTYFSFINNAGSAYYVWYTVNGVGSDPAPGGTGILVPILSTYSIYDLVSLTAAAINGYQYTSITTIAASAMTSPCYFQFTSNSVTYIITYYIDGVGSTFAGGINIPVDIAGTDDINTVATKTLLAINSYQFATPNLKDMILRGVNPGYEIIIGQSAGDINLRFALINTTLSDNPQAYGTYQYSDNRNHSHYVHYTEFTGLSGGGTAYYQETTQDFPGDPNFLIYSSDQGGTESRPVNYGVCFAIRY